MYLGHALLLGGTGEPDPSAYLDELPPVSREYQAETEQARHDQLLSVYGNNKELPEGHELQALLLENQPFNAQTGILGHELAHTFSELMEHRAAAAVPTWTHRSF